MGTENLTSEAVEQPGNEQAIEAVQPGSLYDAELAAAQRELAAQEGSAEGQQSAEAAPEGDPTVQAQPNAEGVPPVAKEEPKVPVSAIYKERKHRQAVELENARLQGELDAMRRMQQAPEGEQQAHAAEQAPTDPLAQMEAEQDALAERFDAGELSALDWQRQNRALQKQIDDARMAQRETQAIRSDQSLEAHAAQLVRDYPVLNAITDQQAAILSDLAYAEAAREGKPIGTGIEATKDLRTRIAVLATKLYGGATQPGQTTQSQAGGQTLSQEALAREAKLDLQRGMPPDVSRMGSAASGVSMSEEEVLDRLNRLPDNEAMALLNTMPALKARITGELGIR